MNAEDDTPVSCPCCKSNTCYGHELHAVAVGEARGLADTVALYKNLLRDAQKDAERWRRAFERNRIVIELLAKYPEEDDHGR